MDLARRWRHGFKDEGDSSISTDDMTELREMVFLRRGEHSESELMAVVVGLTYPDQESTIHLLEEFGSPQDLMTSLALDMLEPFRKDNVLHLRLPKTQAAIEFGSFCRLFAAVKLAHRYRAQTGPKPTALKPGMFGLKSTQLVQLLDPASPLDSELREGMIEVLRSHPQLAEDFAKLDGLAGDAQTSDYEKAIKLHQMFAELRTRRTWSHPSEVLGEKIPYGALLAIAEARIERASRRPVRLLKIKELLEQAEQGAADQPIESFVEALVRLKLSRSSAERAIKKARRRYLESGREQGGGA
ncbi:MAG: hypothetical protein GY725_10900 [bacterium]|nr:hypothetical protein [bacterium]